MDAQTLRFRDDSVLGLQHMAHAPVFSPASLFMPIAPQHAAAVPHVEGRDSALDVTRAFMAMQQSAMQSSTMPFAPAFMPMWMMGCAPALCADTPPAYHDMTTPPNQFMFSLEQLPAPEFAITAPCVRDVPSSDHATKPKVTKKLRAPTRPRRGRLGRSTFANMIEDALRKTDERWVTLAYIYGHFQANLSKVIESHPKWQDCVRRTLCINRNRFKHVPHQLGMSHGGMWGLAEGNLEPRFGHCKTAASNDDDDIDDADDEVEEETQSSAHSDHGYTGADTPPRQPCDASATTSTSSAAEEAGAACDLASILMSLNKSQ